MRQEHARAEIEARGFKLPDDLAQLMALRTRHGHEFVGPPLGDE